MELHNSYSHSFSINEISYSGTSFTRHVNNELDYFGSLLGTARLPEERNSSYKKNIMSTFIKVVNTYRDLIDFNHIPNYKFNNKKIPQKGIIKKINN